MSEVKKSGRGSNQLGKKRGPYKTKSLDQYKDEQLGKIGTVERDKFESESKIKEVFMHSKPKKNAKRSRTTVAGIINYATKTVSVHGARNNTSLGETFKRHIGREVSLGRAKKHPLLTAKFQVNKRKKINTARQVFNELANQIIRRPYKISDDPILRGV